MTISELLDQFEGNLVSLISGETKKVYQAVSGEDFTVKFLCAGVGLTIQSYHRELYTYAFPIDAPEKEASVRNIVLFLKQWREIEWHYFHEVENIEECYRFQLKNILLFLKEHMESIKAFYKPDGFEERFRQLREYVISLNPSLFSTG